jgi:hypothetical protein
MYQINGGVFAEEPAIPCCLISDELAIIVSHSHSVAYLSFFFLKSIIVRLSAYLSYLLDTIGYAPFKLTVDQIEGQASLVSFLPEGL